jgi:hypothetical protein
MTRVAAEDNNAQQQVVVLAEKLQDSRGAARQELSTSGQQDPLATSQFEPGIQSLLALNGILIAIKCPLDE